MTKIKICGVTQPAHAVAAAEARADFIGLVFAPSRRRLTLREAEAIATAVRRRAGPAPRLVGLFVNAPAAEVNDAASALGLDMVQLSGDEPPDYLAQIERPVIKTVRVPPHLPQPVAVATVGRELAALRGTKALPLLDTEIGGSYGGTGTPFDWEIARQLAPSYAFLLAGGLTPGSVEQAVRVASPWGVDVSSGVETDGAKDPAKIRAFIEAVRAADRG